MRKSILLGTGLLLLLIAGTASAEGVLMGAINWLIDKIEGLVPLIKIGMEG